MGAVLIEAQGGTYTDETTGRANTLLSTPLISAANVGMGANTLHVTPLTAIAYSQATRAGSISIAAFNTAATQVRDAFGLPADVDLKATLPVVDLAGANPYGTALRGLSRMISMGASLSGMLANSNLDGLKSGYALSAQCLPGNPEVGAPQQPLQGTITLDDAVRPDGGVAFLVTNPVAAWRSLLPASGSVMGCDVTVNTSASVTLTCPANQPSATLIGGTAANASRVPPSLPVSGLLIVGQSIRVQGPLNVAGNLTIDSGPTGNTLVVTVPRCGSAIALAPDGQPAQLPAAPTTPNSGAVTLTSGSGTLGTITGPVQPSVVTAGSTIGGTGGTLTVTGGSTLLTPSGAITLTSGSSVSSRGSVTIAAPPSTSATSGNVTVNSSTGLLQPAAITSGGTVSGTGSSLSVTGGSAR